MINLIVASSNLIAIYFYYISEEDISFIFLPMIASILYHLGETKHGLPGIYPFNSYTQLLLNIDRTFAIISAGIFFLSIYNHPEFLTLKIFSLFILSILFLTYSERDIIYQNLFGVSCPPKFYQVRNLEFLLTHSLWHCLAYYGLYLVLNLY